MNNEVAKPKSLMAAQKDYVSSIGNGLKDIIGNMDKYQAICGYNILSQINVLLAKEGLDFKSPKVDRESINNAIKYVIVYRLNADNREVFTIVRNEKRGTNQNGQPVYIKVIEVKPQYRGVLKILSTYGRDVKRVFPEWIVREKDPFTYPMFKGIEQVPPTWTRKDSEGKIVRVVVPIMYKDGTVDYRIAERESVATNIKAQIKQSIMFDSKKEEILAKIQDMSLDELLSDKTLSKLINDTYTGLSKEEMLITKLVLNAVKRVQINYESALARELNEKTFDNADVYKKSHNAEEVLAMANAPMLDVKEVEEEAPKVDEDGVVTREEEPLNAQRIRAMEEAKANEEKTDDDFYSLFEGDDD